MFLLFCARGKHMRSGNFFRSSALFFISHAFTLQPVLAALLLIVLCVPSMATTKGLNQIVTPDIQPMGQISISLQAQNPVIGNSIETQIEAGFTQRFEMALFLGLSPGDQILNAEYGLSVKQPWLLSVGLNNWSRRGAYAQPYIEAGYYKGRIHSMIGYIHANNREEAIVGLGYQTMDNLMLQADFQSGEENFSTVGFTYNLTPNLSFNPAVYISNDSSHDLYGYAVLTWSFTAFK